MAAHSSVLAWRIPGTRAPGGLPSMGSHRVRHSWSNLAAAAAAAAGTSYKQNHALLVHLWKACFIQHNVFRFIRVIYGSAFPSFFRLNNIFHCMYRPHFVYLFIHQRTSGLFPPFSYYAQCHFAHGYANQITAFKSLRYRCRSGIASIPVFDFFWRMKILII